MTLDELRRLPEGTLVKVFGDKVTLFGMVHRSGLHGLTPVIKYEDGGEGVILHEWQAERVQEAGNDSRKSSETDEG
jgi:hypothetical protein